VYWLQADTVIATKAKIASDFFMAFGFGLYNSLLGSEIQ
jgi:hypothetical protein